MQLSDTVDHCFVINQLHYQVSFLPCVHARHVGILIEYVGLRDDLSSV